MPWAILEFSIDRADAKVAVQMQVDRNGLGEMANPVGSLPQRGVISRADGDYVELHDYLVKVFAVGFERYRGTLDEIVGQQLWPVGKPLPLLSIQLAAGATRSGSLK